MKKLLLALIILFNNIQIFCSNQKTQESIDNRLIKKANHAIKHGTAFIKLQKMVKNIRSNTIFNQLSTLRNLYPDLFLQLINKEDIDGYTFLTQAIKNKNILGVQLLIALGADVNQEDKNGNSALHDAAIFNFNEAISVLVGAGATINLPNKSGQTPLHIASYGEEDNEIIKTLITIGAKINLQDELGNTPLHYVVANINHMTKSSDENMVAFLIAHNADETIKNKRGCTVKERTFPRIKTIIDHAVRERNKKNLAATKIQALTRGFLARKNLKNEIEK